MLACMQVSVGVGALAGSTIMLLTLPWFLAVLGGRVDIVNGRPNYRKVLHTSCSMMMCMPKAIMRSHDSYLPHAFLACFLTCSLAYSLACLLAAARGPQLEQIVSHRHGSHHRHWSGAALGHRHRRQDHGGNLHGKVVAKGRTLPLDC